MNSAEYSKLKLRLQSRSLKAEERLAAYEKAGNRFSAVRLISFIVFFAAVVLMFGVSPLSGWLSLAVLTAVFGVIVHFHSRLVSGIRRLKLYKRINEENIARMEIDWTAIPREEDSAGSNLSDIERDLDLCGERSLHCLIDNTVSEEGSRMLRKRLGGNYPGAAELKQLQSHVKELASAGRLTVRFQLKARLVSAEKLDCGKITGMLDGLSGYKLPKAVLAVSCVLCPAVWAMIIFAAVNPSGAPLFAMILANLGFYFTFARNTGKLLEASAEIETEVSKLYSVISVLPKYLPEGDHSVARSYPDLFKRDSGFHSSLRRLMKLSGFASYRENPVLKLVLNILLPYDFYVHKSLETTTEELRHNISLHLIELNEIECSVALANFSELNPDYAFADIDGEAKCMFRGKDMAHPLIKREFRKSNDFELGRENELVIITGSNMSGKSTFLRTAGINLCLAYSGGPSACSEMQASAFRIFTCIRVNDSVFDGISYFYAEVKRLRKLLDMLEQPGTAKVLFMIDEIFKGTNNRERIEGSLSFLKAISQKECTGFVSTHDLEIARLSDSIPNVRNFHFREEIENGVMSFEYKIHAGVCPTTNALEIMRMNGLPVER